MLHTGRKEGCAPSQNRGAPASCRSVALKPGKHYPCSRPVNTGV